MEAAKQFFNIRFWGAFVAAKYGSRNIRPVGSIVLTNGIVGLPPRAIQQFLAWSERPGYQHLEDIEPITVVAYIEMLQRKAAPPTVKQHMAAIRMLVSRLTS